MLLCCYAAVLLCCCTQQHSKARNRAISYIPSKPDKFGVRFYCVIGTSGPYIHSIFDNGRGWNTGINQVDSYNHLHGEFAQILNRKFGPESTVARNSASALWLCQLVDQSRLYREPNHYRVIFCDNFYTRPRLAEKLFSVSQGDLKVTGTCKVPNFDGINRPIIVDCLKLLKNAERGFWLLARTYSYDKQYDDQRKRSGDPNVKSYRVIPDKYIQPNSGFIFFKDAKVVIFHSNDLASTPHDRICKDTDARSITSVRGLAMIERWTGVEIIARSRINCPTINISYQLFMNSFDRVDQLRSTAATRRKERRIHMSLWTYCIDLTVHQANRVYNELLTQKRITEKESEEEDGVESYKPLRFDEFRRRLCEQLVDPLLLAKKKRQSTSSSSQKEMMDSTVGKYECHVLLLRVLMETGS